MKNCTENFVGDETVVKSSSVEDEEERGRRCSSDSGNSSWEDHYPYFIDRECREFIESAPIVSFRREIVQISSIAEQKSQM